MKKLSLLVLLVLLVTTLCGGAHAELAPLNTTDQITLRVLLIEQTALFRALADKFTELHPNITIELIETSSATTTMRNLAADNNLPDMYFFTNFDLLVANPFMRDITEFVENDPEYELLYPSLQRIGYIDGERCFFMIGKYDPYLFFLDKAVFDRMNVEMPSQDWTWDEMLELVETMTDPSQQIWGLAYDGIGLRTLGGVGLQDNAIGEYGWDGENYAFDTAWVECADIESEFIRLGYRPMQGSEEWLAVEPDDINAGESGRVAMAIKSFWQLNSIYLQTAAQERGLQMVPYLPPRGEGVENGGQFSAQHVAGISPTCEYPREAYEALKFLSWGKEGWLARCEAYATLTDENGEKLYQTANCLPLIRDEEAKQATIELLPDLGYWNDWEGFFDAITNPVTYGGRTIPGFNTFITDYYHGADFAGHTGIITAIEAGDVDPYDYADDLNEKGRQYYEEAMEVFYTIYGQPSAE